MSVRTGLLGAIAVHLENSLSPEVKKYLVWSWFLGNFSPVLSLVRQRLILWVILFPLIITVLGFISKIIYDQSVYHSDPVEQKMEALFKNFSSGDAGSMKNVDSFTGQNETGASSGTYRDIMYALSFVMIGIMIILFTWWLIYFILLFVAMAGKNEQTIYGIYRSLVRTRMVRLGSLQKI